MWDKEKLNCISTWNYELVPDSPENALEDRKLSIFMLKDMLLMSKCWRLVQKNYTTALEPYVLQSLHVDVPAPEHETIIK